MAASTVSGDYAAIAHQVKYIPALSEVLRQPLLQDALKVCTRKAVQSKPKQHMSAELMQEIVAHHEQRRAGEEQPRTEQAQRRLWLRERNVTMMLLMMLGMLRESEAVELRVEDVKIGVAGECMCSCSWLSASPDGVPLHPDSRQQDRSGKERSHGDAV